MSALLVLARVIHVVGGVFWGGAILFVNFLLGPSVTSVGPDGVKVMRELVRRRYFEIIVGAATLTVASGVYLIWVDSAGFTSTWFASPFGRGISTGMLAAILAYLLGVFVVRPALYRLLALGAEMAQAAPGDRAGVEGRLTAARSRLITAGSISTLFLLVAILAMATARYL